MTDEIYRWLLPIAIGPTSAVGGWFFARRQRHVQTETGALDLYESALKVLESSQAEVSRMSGDREEMRVQLEECVRARNEAGLERAKDRVRLAQLEQQLAEIIAGQTTAKGLK